MKGVPALVEVRKDRAVVSLDYCTDILIRLTYRHPDCFCRSRFERRVWKHRSSRTHRNRYTPASSSAVDLWHEFGLASTTATVVDKQKRELLEEA